MLVSYGVSMYWSRRGGGMLVSYGVSMYWSRRGGGMLVSYGVSMYIVLSLWKTMVCICSRGINQSRNMDRNVATMVLWLLLVVVASTPTHLPPPTPAHDVHTVLLSFCPSSVRRWCTGWCSIRRCDCVRRLCLVASVDCVWVISLPHVPTVPSLSLTFATPPLRWLLC